MEKHNSQLFIKKTKAGSVQMTSVHTNLLIVGILTQILRFILRTIFVIVTESVIGIPLVIASLVSIPMLLQLQRSGGCMSTFLYFLAEPLLSTIYWCAILFVIDTNVICFDLGDTVCYVENSQDSNEFTSRMHPWWITLLIPGLIFDLTFTYFFRNPVVAARVSTKPQKIEFADPNKGQDTAHLRGIDNQVQHLGNSLDKPITGLNRPASPSGRSARSN